MHALTAISQSSDKAQDQQCPHVTRNLPRAVSLLVQVAPEHHSPDDVPGQRKQTVRDQDAECADQQFYGTLQVATSDDGTQQEQADKGASKCPFDDEPGRESEGNAGHIVIDAVSAAGEDKVTDDEGNVKAQEDGKDAPQIARSGSLGFHD